MSKLFFVALACLFAVVVADTTQIQVAYYKDAGCTTLGDAPATNYTSGNCFFNTLMYSQDSANTNVYLYLFKTGTTACPVANITNVIAYQANVCGAAVGTGAAPYVKYSIFTGATNPAAPTAFPPTGFTANTLYVNASGATYDNTCSSTVIVQSAAPTPATTSSCIKTNNDMNSVQSFLNSACTTAVVGYYSDASCTNLVRTVSKTVEFKACSNGVKTVCSGSDSSLPSISGSAVGLTQYDNAGCNTNSNTQVTAALSGACYGGSAVSCTTQNSTQFLTAVQYANTNCSGDVTQTTYIGVNTCLTSGNVVNATATCSAPSGPNSASAASVSAIVMIAAAFVALVAGRQL